MTRMFIKQYVKEKLRVFQLESRHDQFHDELQPDKLEDVIAGISLYRPTHGSNSTYIANKRIG